MQAMRYTSDLTDRQWEMVSPLLGKTRNRKYDKRELVNAALYVVILIRIRKRFKLLSLFVLAILQERSIVFNDFNCGSV